MNLKRKILALVALLAVPLLGGCGATSESGEAGNKANPQAATTYTWSSPFYVQATFSTATSGYLTVSRSVYLCFASPTDIHWCTYSSSYGYSKISRTPLYKTGGSGYLSAGTVVVNNVTYSNLQFVWAVDNPLSNYVTFATNMGWNGMTVTSSSAANVSFMLPVVYYNAANLPATYSAYTTWKSNITGAGNVVFRTSCGLGGATSTPTIKIPRTQTHVMPGAFTGCTSLKSVDLTYNTVTSIDTQAFQGCTGLSTIVIPNSVTKIGFAAFANCTSLASVTIPTSVTYIDLNAFYRCTSLKSLIYPGNSVYTLNTAAEGDTAGDGIDDANSLVMIDSGTKLYIAMPGCSSYAIPSTVTEISVNAFASCLNLTSITVPEGVTVLRKSAFLNCSALTTVSLPSTLTSIGEYCFAFDGVLATINFAGTKAQWATVTRGLNWRGGSPTVPTTTVVTCSDGTTSL
jgi:hypothetical protein